jgi:hypothetical protein
MIEADSEYRKTLVQDHETIKDEISSTIESLSEMIPTAIAAENTFATRRYSVLSHSPVKHLGQMESTRV